MLLSIKLCDECYFCKNPFISLKGRSLLELGDRGGGRGGGRATWKGCRGFRGGFKGFCRLLRENRSEGGAVLRKKQVLRFEHGSEPSRPFRKL